MDGGGGFSDVVATFSQVGRSFNILWPPPVVSKQSHLFEFGVLFWMYVEHIPMSSQIVVNISGPSLLFFSIALDSWGLSGGKHYQKVTIAIFRFVLQNFTIPGYFPYILFCSCLFPYFLMVGLLLQYVALFQSRELVKVNVIVNWCRVAVSNDQST